MTDLMIVVILAAVIGAAARYVYKARKRGVKCIGCAVEGGCPGKGGGACGCGCGNEASGCGCHTDAAK